MFVEEHSLRVLAVHLAKSWLKYHQSYVYGKMYGTVSLCHLFARWTATALRECSSTNTTI